MSYINKSALVFRYTPIEHEPNTINMEFFIIKNNDN